MQLSLFATEEHPLRASSVPLLMKCTLRAALMFGTEGQGGPAADTGSATHVAIHEWHKDHDAKRALKAMREKGERYPLASFSEAELNFLPYTKDPRNKEAIIVASEQEVKFEVDGVWFCGTLDQVRHEGHDYRLHDVKTGSPEGWEMMHDYVYQVAVYCVGASKLLGKPVLPGSIIRTRGYRKHGVNAASSPPGVFFNFTLDLNVCISLVTDVVSVVKRVRAGEVQAGPGKHCGYCDAGNRDGVGFCVPRRKELIV